MTLYVAGGMRGYPKYHFAEFFRISTILMGEGHDTYNPAQMDLIELIDRGIVPMSWDWEGISEEEFNKVISVFTLEECLRRDIEAIMKCEGIVFMEGWRRSEGANKELAVAKMIGLKLYEFIDDKLVELKEDAGRKFDGAKRKWCLAYRPYFRGTVDVLMHGLIKYARDNYQIVPNPYETYTDALQRHLDSYVDGEKLDKDSGMSHLWHMSCCLMFLNWFDDHPDKVIQGDKK